MQKVPSSPLVSCDDVGADPADAGVGLVALGGRARGGGLEVGGVAEAVAALDDVELHEHHSLGRGLGDAADATGARSACHPRHCRTCRADMPYFAHGAPAPPVSSPDGERADRQAGGARAARGAAGAPRATAAAPSCCSPARPASARPGWPPSWPGAPDAPVLRGAASQGRTPPYGPLVAALRAHLRARPGGPRRLRAAARPPRAAAARARRARRRRPTARRCSRRCAARSRSLGHALVVLDDLQWSDEATLEVLRGARRAARRVPAADRRGLPLRRPAARPRRAPPAPRPAPRRPARRDRAARRSAPAETRELLARVLGAPPGAVARARDPRPHARACRSSSRSSPSALRVSGALRRRPRRASSWRGGGEVPLPDTVRDAVLIARRRARPTARRARGRGRGRRRRRRSTCARRRARRRRRALTELLETRLVREDGAAPGAFRHALAREALYADVPVDARAATLHRALAEALGAPRRAEPRGRARTGSARATTTRARDALLRAAAESEAVHAYRDAAEAGRQALELLARRATTTPAAPTRSSATRAAASSPASSPRPRAPGASWSPARGGDAPVADAQRRLAAVHELRGDRDAASRARLAAADGVRGRPARTADAAVERLAIANQRRLAGAPRRGDRARRAPRGADADARRPARPARARAGHRGHGARQARRLRGRAGDGPRRRSRSRSSTTSPRSPPSSTSASA